MNKLEGVHPELVEKVTRVLAKMQERGFPMVVTDGLRTLAQQQALYAKGRTRPGPIVTNADGVRHRSNHQAHDDGYGHAVDCTFVDEHGQPTWDETLPWNVYGTTVLAVGLRWGGLFRSPVDRPHVELP